MSNRLGRTRSAWRDWHEARQAQRITRRDVLSRTIQFVTGAVILLATLFATAFHLAR